MMNECAKFSVPERLEAYCSLSLALTRQSPPALHPHPPLYKTQRKTRPGNPRASDPIVSLHKNVVIRSVKQVKQGWLQLGGILAFAAVTGLAKLRTVRMLQGVPFSL